MDKNKKTQKQENQETKSKVKYLTLKEEAFEYHRQYPSGKTSILPTKSLSTQYDLSLAYTPGVGEVSKAIAQDPSKIYDYTNIGNLLAIISNGTAVLGLGNIGPKAAKPVMEGKSVLLKKFANIDCYDLEINAHTPEAFIQTVKPLEPSFGGIILEDIKAPECFVIENELKKQMNIPVFHDDQHGTAIVVGAGLINAIEITHRHIETMKIVVTGAGAASIACLNFICSLGAKKENIFVFDSKGLITQDRTDLNEYKKFYAQPCASMSLKEALKNADLFLGVSKGNLLSEDMVLAMNKAPIILALANPTPEISPDVLYHIDKNAIICTGRSDYSNQINNVLCFPFLFRGVLDVQAKTITPHMMQAAAYAIADLAKQPIPFEVLNSYTFSNLSFSKDYIIPFPFDPRLLPNVASAVAQAAIEDNVAQKSLDIHDYKKKLEHNMDRNRPILHPLYLKIQRNHIKKRLIFCNGENREVLNTVGKLIDENLAHPILVGRKEVIQKRMEQQSLHLNIHDPNVLSICDPESDSRYSTYWRMYFEKMQRSGINKSSARLKMRTNTTLIGAMLLDQKEGDCMITGMENAYHEQVDTLESIFPEVNNLCTAAILKLPNRTIFINNPVSAYENKTLTASELGQCAIQTANFAQHMGFTPNVALLSNSNYGSNHSAETRVMQETLAYLKLELPNFIFDGEMDLNLAIHPELTLEYLSNPILKNAANVLILPSYIASHFMIQAIQMFVPGVQVISPILLGCVKPIQITNMYANMKEIMSLSIYLTSLN